ncbi:MAG: phosphotransferase [Saprospiraceae bacterium]|nr:phosphotransferase [Saprospiraceae bacterium]MCB9321094.1 phosphotransferase [Lewinellaceae bacterium]
MNELETRYAEALPGKYYLTRDLESLEIYLREHFFLDPRELVLKAEKPGEGNMNYVLRITTNIRSFIIKQARPWVEKYPSISAPVERNAVEARYFKLTQKFRQLSSFSPDLLFEDNANNILILSDLGPASDYSFLYQSGTLSGTEVQALVHYLKTLHQVQESSYPWNQSMRVLNHEHIFRFPFDPKNHFDLDAIQPGLQALADPVKHHQDLKEKIQALGQIYLTEGEILIHGDFFPGSWLKTDSGIRIIDPEFSFRGFAEFDLGVLIAHLLLSGQPVRHRDAILENCQKQRNLDEQLIAGFCGTEVLRRLLGVAQLPLRWSIQEKASLIQTAIRSILQGTLNAN